MKLNWLFLIEAMVLITVAQIVMQSIGITGVMYYVACFMFGFFIDNILSWVHSRPMRLFEIEEKSLDKENEKE